MPVPGHIQTVVRHSIQPVAVVNRERTLVYANDIFWDTVVVGAAGSEMDSGNPIDSYIRTEIFADEHLIPHTVIEKGEVVAYRRLRGKLASGRSVMISVNMLPSTCFHDVDGFALLFLMVYDTKFSGGDQEQEDAAIMSGSINEYTQLKLKQNEELEIARSVQKSLLPDSLPGFVHIDIAVEYAPAESVSGDLYDIIKLNDQKTAFLIFDVSGQGVPAALVASIARMLFSECIRDGRKPSEILYEVNERLTLHSPPHFYLTAFLGIFDSMNNTLHYSKAGHVPPLVYRDATGEVEWITGRGSFVGHPALKDVAVYTDEQIMLGNFDKILMYTDGLTESWNRNEELYGRQRIFEAVQENGDLRVHEFVNAIFEHNKQFRNGAALHDDMTILGVQLGCPDKLIERAGFNREDNPEVKVIHSYEEVDRVCFSILRELDRCGYPNSFFYWTKLCIYEMVSNALRHGNRYDPAKSVTILYRVDYNAFSISVLDEGDGFDYTCIPDPRKGERLYKPNGRGLFIVRHYMDEVEFNEKGNRIKAFKRRSPF